MSYKRQKRNTTKLPKALRDELVSLGKTIKTCLTSREAFPPEEYQKALIWSEWQTRQCSFSWCRE
jgi:hypothetical protein